MSTLFVNNLNTASGTSIALASGKTLDASGGTLTPSVGQVVQIATNTITQASFQTTSTSFTDVTGWFVNITPKFNNSKIIWRTNITSNVNDDNGYGRFRVVDANNSDTQIHAATYVGQAGYYAATNAWDEHQYTCIMASSGTTNAMQLQLQVAVFQGGTYSANWSSGDGRVIEAIEIKV